MRVLAMAYSVFCYFVGVSALLLLIAFIGNLPIPVTIDTGSPFSADLLLVSSVLVNVALIVAWGLQHSVMADPRFKAWWTRFVPPALERSTYLLFTGVLTYLLVAFWVPIPMVVWDVSGTALGTVLMVGYGLGWAIVFFSSFLINHFQLFGLEQAYRNLTQTQSKKSIFVTPLLYRIVRHPMMTGVLIALWCAPTLTLGRLVLNVVMTIYILVGTRHEETLLADLGDDYEAYRRTTPMLIPTFKGRKLQPLPRSAT